MHISSSYRASRFGGFICPGNLQSPKQSAAANCRQSSHRGPAVGGADGEQLKLAPNRPDQAWPCFAEGFVPSDPFLQRTDLSGAEWSGATDNLWGAAALGAIPQAAPLLSPQVAVA